MSPRGNHRNSVPDLAASPPACNQLELKSYLNKRGYNLSFLNQEVARVQNITRTQALTPKDIPTANQPQRVPLVITYNPALRYVSALTKTSTFCLHLPVALTFSKLNPSLPSDGQITLVI